MRDNEIINLNLDIKNQKDKCRIEIAEKNSVIENITDELAQLDQESYNYLFDTKIELAQHNETIDNLTREIMQLDITNDKFHDEFNAAMETKNKELEEKNIEIINLNLAIKKHNRPTDHDDYAFAPTTQVSTLKIKSLTVRQDEDNIQCLVREHEARVESLTLLLENENDTANNEAVGTIRGGIEYFANFL